MTARICAILNCREPLSERTRFDVCPRCRASILLWEKRKPAHILRRRENLQRYAHRMQKVSK